MTMKVILDGGSELITISYPEDYSFQINLHSHGFVAILDEQNKIKAYFNINSVVGMYIGEPEIEPTRNLYGKDEK